MDKAGPTWICSHFSISFSISSGLVVLQSLQGWFNGLVHVVSPMLSWPHKSSHWGVWVREKHICSGQSPCLSFPDSPSSQTKGNHRPGKTEREKIVVTSWKELWNSIRVLKYGEGKNLRHFAINWPECTNFKDKNWNLKIQKISVEKV